MTFYFNLESLVLPDSQVHPFYTPSSRPIFGDVRRCSTMFGEVRRGSARFGEVRRGSARFGEVRRGSAMLSDVIRCSAMFGDVRRCSTMFGDVIRCSAILSELQFTIVTVPRIWLQLLLPSWHEDHFGLSAGRCTCCPICSQAVSHA